MAVARLAAKLGASTAASDADAVRAALRALDIDWRGATGAQRSAGVRAALEAARAAVAPAAKRISTVAGEMEIEHHVRRLGVVGADETGLRENGVNGYRPSGAREHGHGDVCRMDHRRKAVRRLIPQGR